MDHTIKARHAKRLALRGNVEVYLFTGIKGIRVSPLGTNWKEISKEYRKGNSTYQVIFNY